MPPEGPWYVRLRDRFLKVWRTQNPRMAIVRDIAAAAVIVGVLLAGIWIYAGQPLSQAPVVSVESGSMMHGPFRGGKMGIPTLYGEPPFGRVGTIDPGDIVFVKRVRSADDVETAFGDGSREGYGGHGDTTVFMPNGSNSRTRVIHRAMLYVEVEEDGCMPRAAQNPCVFRIREACNPEFSVWAGNANVDKYCEGTTDLVTLSLNREGLFLTLTEFPCWNRGCEAYTSAFITKGDNNECADQDPCSNISAPVRLSWIIGKARGEIPWFGLIKLALYGNDSYGNGASDPTAGSNWKLLNATAPWDIWLSLLISLGVLISIPMVLDFVGNLRAKRKAEGKRPPKPPTGGPSSEFPPATGETGDPRAGDERRPGP
ncbi:MAG: S26 family signal peptidase [Euryarchaeota archaeon]|nr:S26 family signal peptidase [Euryarchaeota archaeon]